MTGPGRQLARLVPIVVARRHSIGVFLAVVAGVVVASPSAAIADSARPTDFRSEVVAIDPPTPSIAVSIVGGDAFVLLRVDPGVEVEVEGYESEPYLRFAADGSGVREPELACHVHQRLPLRRRLDSGGCFGRRRAGLGRGRAGGERRVRLARPPFPPDAADRARRRATGRPGLHRRGADRRRRGSRWMFGSRARGCPLRRDGLRCSARSLGVLVVVAAFVVPTRRVWGPVLVGVGANRGGDRVDRLRVPPRASPARVPCGGCCRCSPWRSAIAAWVLGPTPGGYAAAAIAGLELAAWAFDRRAGLSKALLPTDAPYWIDRAVTVAAFTVGVVAAAVAIAGLFRSIRGPAARSPR